MPDPVPHPCAVEITPTAKPPGSDQWAVRRSAALIERSDRTHASEAKVYEQALEAIECDRTFSARPVSVRG